MRRVAPGPGTLVRDLGVFFTSIRRNTRYWRDWSSDVCSSDLSKLDIEADRGGSATAHGHGAIVASGQRSGVEIVDGGGVSQAAASDRHGGRHGGASKQLLHN